MPLLNLHTCSFQELVFVSPNNLMRKQRFLRLVPVLSRQAEDLFVIAMHRTADLQPDIQQRHFERN